MKRHNLLFVFVGGFGILAAAIAWQASFSGAQPPPDKAKAVEGPLPIRQVVLFNSGVGYFQREGEVVGDSRVDLTFPASDINDLLKSLVLQDLGGGLISTVNYDSHDPIEKILRGFALDLNNNPSFGQILNQARGEKIEIGFMDKKAAKLIGTIVGMETQRQAAGKDSITEVELLNLSGPNGLQSVPLAQVAGVRFLNATLDNEFQRALKVLAASHDTQKKLVTLGFNGVGKRAVRVGYVVERPIWKTSYRLRMEPNGKVFLQGWAMVENTSDDDWNDVRMVLVSGKPISYQMNLYEPLYIPRPMVEPELFASLRPPVYNGALDGQQSKEAAGLGVGFGGFGGQMGIGGFGGQIGQIGQFGQAGFGGQFGQFGMIGGGQIGQIGQLGFQGGGFQGNRYQQVPTTNSGLLNNRLTYQELQQRRLQMAEQKEEAKKTGSAVVAMNFKEGIQSVASAEEVGDYFQYVLDQKITLSRQKSAMVPILDHTIEGIKVSIFNESIHAKYPLLGLHLKNTSGKPLTQGPITVYDGGNYAGDTRILNLQPNEERLLSYALDQGTEIKTEKRSYPGTKMNLRLDGTKLAARFTMREIKTYIIKNRSNYERTVILEHPIRVDWKLADTKPSEQTRDVYRFTVTVPAGKNAFLEVAEEQPQVDQMALQGKTPSYGPLFGIEVQTVNHHYQDQLIGLRIQKGVLLTTVRMRGSRIYTIQNISEENREFLIDHPIIPKWKVVDESGEPLKSGPDAFRFKLSVPKGKSAAKEIMEESIHKDMGTDLKLFAEAGLREFLNHPIPSPEVKTALTKVISLAAKVAETAKQKAGVEKQLDDLTKDQGRLRSNLQIIPQSSEHYKKFLEKFVAQEAEIENLQRQVRQVQAALNNQEREYQVFVAGLNAE